MDDLVYKFKPQVIHAAVHSKVVVLLLFILLFYVPLIVCGGSVLVFVLVCTTLCPF